tara:strand:- start:14162 stop:14563 length:402 start_codon:yes stop_codon:yes gene_type:complete
MNRDEIASLNPNAILWDGLDEAIIGLAKRTNLGPLVVYNIDGPIDVNLYSLESEDEDVDNWNREIFEGIVAYDADKIISLLMVDMEVDDDDLEENQTVEDAKYGMALEYFDYNIASGYVGEFTPIHLFIKEIE